MKNFFCSQSLDLESSPFCLPLRLHTNPSDPTKKTKWYVFFPLKPLFVSQENPETRNTNNSTTCLVALNRLFCFLLCALCNVLWFLCLLKWLYVFGYEFVAVQEVRGDWKSGTCELWKGVWKTCGDCGRSRPKQGMLLLFSLQIFMIAFVILSAQFLFCNDKGY